MAPDRGQQSSFTIPLSVLTRSDVGRLLREAEAVEEFLHQAAIRKPGTSLQLPKSSQLLEDTMNLNNLSTLKQADRQWAVNELKKLHSGAPVINISFAVDPSAIFLQKLITWLRQQIHPQLLLHIGLQPAMGAGCVIRTTNKYFDFSLGRRFRDKRELLAGLLYQESSPEPSQEQPA